MASIWGEFSGPLVARAFHRVLGAIYLIAFISLGVQIDVLIGSRGLLPLAPLIENLHGKASWLEFPTLFWWAPADIMLEMGIWLGVLLALAAALGMFPRVCFALLVPLYLSYAVACREFLAFQWDNLILECGFLAIFLPRDRPARWIHLLFQFLLFKLYWESGVAKWQSHLGDWQDGSAMTFYYETAPLPTWLAYYAHQLPDWWHQLESRATLVLELLIPFAVFGPRMARIGALILLTGFQGVNLLTANYGFFVYLALALHLFLLNDVDLLRWSGTRILLWPLPDRDYSDPNTSRRGRALGACLAVGVSLFVLGASVIEATRSFTQFEFRPSVEQARKLYAPFRLVNVYHLFGHITRARIEPEFQTLEGEEWISHHLHYKPGPIHRIPPFVAPHQPRVDFRLWFYGLSYRGRMPVYVRTLLERMCQDPAAVQDLFESPLPTTPKAARVAFGHYAFTGPEENSHTYWTRQFVAASRATTCDLARRETQTP